MFGPPRRIPWRKSTQEGTTPRAAVLILSVLFGTDPPLRAAEDEDVFNSKVRPILAGHCFKCHDPDDKARKAKLRLDRREDALRGGKSRRGAIVPGQPEQSELIERIFAEDEGVVMPPPHTKNPLTQEEKQTLKSWIVDGAAYRPHWAFVPPFFSSWHGSKRRACHLHPKPIAMRWCGACISMGAYGQLQWKVSDGPDRSRRELYTFSKRTAPFA
jgi:hypothetical protein